MLLSFYSAVTVALIAFDTPNKIFTYLQTRMIDVSRVQILTDF